MHLEEVALTARSTITSGNASGAFLLSVVDDVTASFVNRNSSTQSVQFSNTADSGQKAAQIALSHSVDIPPTLTKDQGGIVKVFVARDLYFGNVYGFRTAQR